MNILFITPYLPSENSGHAGAQLIYRNIVSLAKNLNITLASFIDSNEQDEKRPLEQKGISVNTILYPRNQRSVANKVASALRNIGHTIGYFVGREPFFFGKYSMHSKKPLNLLFELLQYAL